MNREKVVVAELLRPRGNRGEIFARSTTDVPGRFETLKHAHASLPGNSSVPVAIEDAWRHKDGWVLKLAGVDSINEAERFRGADLWVAASERAALPQGEFFQSDLIDCRIIDTATGECIGTLEGWQDYGGTPLMQITVHGREVLIPFVPAYCEIDLAARSIRVNVPPGLLEL